jgi:hypothetical protein
MPNLTFTALTMKKLTFRTPALWTRRASLLALSGSLALFLSACERNLTPDGPNLGDLYGNFEIREGLQVSATTVDFSAGQTVHFTAKTSIAADWVLEVRGTTSGSRWADHPVPHVCGGAVQRQALVARSSGHAAQHRPSDRHPRAGRHCIGRL